MSDYTIKSGDCLWNIARDNYHLTSNADIANAVKAICDANQGVITNPNSIPIGQTFTLPDDIFTQNNEPKKEYTIQSGDCLWNIARDSYHLTSNTDIANAVKAICDANQGVITNPNSIPIGQTFTLPNIFGLEASNNNENAPQAEENSIESQAYPFEVDENSKRNYEAYKKWSTSSYNYKRTSDGKFADSYRYILGANLNTENAKNQLLNIAKGQIYADDTSKDGKLDINEYTLAAQSNYKAMTGIAPKQSAFEGIFNNIDLDENGYLDEKELASYYSALDRIDSSKDGLIQFNSTTISSPNIKEEAEIAYKEFFG